MTQWLSFQTAARIPSARLSMESSRSVSLYLPPEQGVTCFPQSQVISIALRTERAGDGVMLQQFGPRRQLAL